MISGNSQFIRSDVFERIFYPRSIAILGVSSRGNVFGSGILSALETIGFEGRIHAVNRNGGNLNGRTLYRSVSEIPEPIDFAIIAVPAPHVPQALEECRLKGAAGAEILSSGFSELGTEEGIRLEKEIREICARGIRVIGPNCFGIYCPGSGLTLLPGPELSRKSGPVGFLSQSGGMSIDFAHIGKWMGIGFSKVVSFGNGADLREARCWNTSAETRRRGSSLCTSRGSRTAVISTPRFPGLRQRSRSSSTRGGSLRLVHEPSPATRHPSGVAAGSGSLRCARSGAIQVGDLWEMAETCLAFSHSASPGVREHYRRRGWRSAGRGSLRHGRAVYGLKIPQFSPEISNAILEHLPRPGSSAKTPIDAANPFVSPQAYREILLNSAKDTRVDMQIMIQLMYHYKSVARSMGVSVKDIVPYRELAGVAAEVASSTSKPIVLVLPNIMQGKDALDIEAVFRDARSIFLEKGIPVYDDVGKCLRALGHVSRFASGQAERN